MAAGSKVGSGKKEGEESSFKGVFAKLVSCQPCRERMLFSYIPLAGGASYTCFSIHIFNPNFLSSILPEQKHIVANCLLFNAHLGTGLYLFSRKHLAVSPLSNRITYSVYGAFMFNFGSILLWAVTKVLLPDNTLIRTLFSLCTSAGLIIVGKNYIEYIDSIVSTS
jgi:hypothetical protein